MKRIFIFVLLVLGSVVAYFIPSSQDGDLASDLSSTAQSYCSKQNVAQVSINDKYIKVDSQLDGGGSIYYNSINEEVAKCPVISPDLLSQQCQQFSRLKNWQIICQDDNIPDDDFLDISSFKECIEAGYTVMESYPRQCSTPDGKTFTENIGNTNELLDLIQLDNPKPNQKITSPLQVTGQAKGNWFFEATFPVILTDWDGKIIAEGYAEAEDEWMTEEFVDFSATLIFSVDTFVSNRGSLILQKANPSGLPQNDNALEIPVYFTQQ